MSAFVPNASYRFQLHREFPLRQATAWIPYLHELGVTHVHASPVFKARPGSTHGYDVCDYQALNPELGSPSEWLAFMHALRQHGMGLVLDIVPNHMGIGTPENRWWWDVLTYGPKGACASYFDIDWEPPDPRLRHKVLTPVLGDRYHRVLERGELRLVCENGWFLLRYHEHRFPINPESYPALIQRLNQRRPSPALQPLLTLPANWPGQFQYHYVRTPDLGAAVNAMLVEINQDLRALDTILQQQHYLLTYWGHGDTRLNYRRFFNITTLAGLRVEEEQVFTEAHALLRQWLDQGFIEGLRVDHPDGLRDPEQYCQRLRALAPRAWIVLEKILMPGESLPRSWPVAGTTGYDFLNRAQGLMIDPAGEPPLTDLYAEFTGQSADYTRLVRDKKQHVLNALLRAELDRLTRLLVWLSGSDWRFRDFTEDEMRNALAALIACFPVYRTYARAGQDRIDDVDLAYLREALAGAREYRPDVDAGLFLFLEELLRLRWPGEAAREFLMRFQQLTGPVMAKGVEDTAFYGYHRLVCLNEVGGDPGGFGLSVEAFHRACMETLNQHPHTMLATATHDTKRSLDVRARLSLLSEMPDYWRMAVRRWAQMNERYRQRDWPDRNTEYLFYQTLVGAWPLELDRALAYMDKAVCEAKVHTTYTCRNADYDQALQSFVTQVMGDPAFVEDLEQFVRPLIDPGRINSLGQTLLHMTAPGVPDLYQGAELWDYSLVDPDNRRPVDFALRQRRLAELASLSLEAIVKRRDEGLPKLWLIRQALHLRQKHPEWFTPQAPVAASRQSAAGFNPPSPEGPPDIASYTPLMAAGAKAHHVVAFIRGNGAISIMPRLVLGVKDDWDDTHLNLPEGSWHNLLTNQDITGKSVQMSELLRPFPVALLVRKESL